MQTITTKFLPATACKPSRIKATHEGGVYSITLTRDHALSIEDNYALAASQLKQKLGWPGRMVGGHLKSGMVFVFTDSKSTIYI